jgi:hypothetical protein
MGELLALIVIAYAVLIGAWIIGLLATIANYSLAALAALVGLPAWAAWTSLIWLARRRS